MPSPLLSALDDIIGVGSPVVSVAPVALLAPDRPVPLDVRVSAPATGTDLPLVVFSHGNGWNLDGYAPLTAFWASRGFVVIQPTHLDSRRNGFGFDHPVFPTIWTERIADLTRILDQLDTVEAAVPGLAGRVDRSRIAATGHSWGGQTAQSLLGARILDEDGQVGEDMSDSRITAGVLLAATGLGGDDLHPFAQANFPFMRPSFRELTTPTLVIAGDHDQSTMSSRGPDWFTDAYTHSPGATDLLTFSGAEHALGGIVGYDVAETTDENPERVAVIQRMSTAYLRTALNVDATSWPTARRAFRTSTDPIGRADSK
ncbi:alpha/beta hydrolase family protein [Rathayibacter sp. VKM Ac-2630]|uniref:alpha/beta hydrolase family protein n=1 Tax=Rathayibacter sp. VKM Ac-2630 TaxID=1938617 RepID=UPI000980CAC5|nr:alpha/beta fold hydrolase [Rathayibacter sp. VKM Ac-2630]OOB90642.1 chlorophyllase [Rathayibacter sp. VKM Ac-2630]